MGCLLYESACDNVKASSGVVSCPVVQTGSLVSGEGTDLSKKIVYASVISMNTMSFRRLSRGGAELCRLLLNTEQWFLPQNPLWSLVLDLFWGAGMSVGPPVQALLLPRLSLGLQLQGHSKSIHFSGANSRLEKTERLTSRNNGITEGVRKGPRSPPWP